MRMINFMIYLLSWFPYKNAKKTPEKFRRFIFYDFINTKIYFLATDIYCTSLFKVTVPKLPTCTAGTVDLYVVLISFIISFAMTA